MDSPYEQRREAIARILAASRMGLRNDPTGQYLPQDCWSWMTRKAVAFLFIVSKGDEREEARRDLERGPDSEP